jgi:hypothetical protein
MGQRGRRRGSSGWVLVVLALAAAGAAGCGAGDVDIIGRCEVVTDRVRPLDERPGVIPPPEFAPSVGLLDGQAWVSWMEWEGTDFLDSEALNIWGRWYDPAWAPLGPAEYLGKALRRDNPTYRTQWVRFGGELVGQAWLDPEGDEPFLPTERVHRVRVQPPGDGAPLLERIHVPVSDACPECGLLGLGELTYSTSPEHGLLPSALGIDSVWMALTASAAMCGYADPSLAAGFLRLHLVRGTDVGTAEPLLVGQDFCDLYAHSVGNAFLVPLSSGSLGILYTSGGVLHYAGLTATGMPTTAGSVAGTRIRNSGGGFQPRGVAVPGGRVLFTERRDPGGFCHALRIMREDGSGARDAPWQLPCIRTADGERSTDTRSSSMALVPIPGGAVLVWGQQQFYGEIEPEEAGVFAVMLTPEGKRGSEVVMLTEPSGVSGGPELIVGADAEGNDIAAVWWDSRTLADVGVHARRLRCVVDG